MNVSAHLVRTSCMFAASNFLWAFVFLNYPDIVALEKEKESSNSFVAYARTQAEGYSSWFLIPQETVLAPVDRIVIPSIGKEAPVLLSNSGSESILNRGVLMFDFWGKRDSHMLFGHSSADTEGPYRYVFTRIPKLKEGSEIVLERGQDAYVYSVVWKSVVSPEDIASLPDKRHTIYLVTCYPFLSTLRRYVVEAELKEIVAKKPLLK